MDNSYRRALSHCCDHVAAMAAAAAADAGGEAIEKDDAGCWVAVDGEKVNTEVDRDGVKRSAIAEVVGVMVGGPTSVGWDDCNHKEDLEDSVDRMDMKLRVAVGVKNQGA